MSRLAQLQKLHEQDPSDADILYMLAQEFAKAGDTAQAVAWYDKCLATDPGYLYAYFHKARALQAADDDAGAIACLCEGLVEARRRGDAKAASEMAGFLDELGG